MKNKLIALFLIPVFLISSVMPAYSYSPITEFLGEIGVKFYQQGRYEDALHEFKKSLIVQPNYLPAIKYIRMIEEIQGRAPMPLPSAAVEEALAPAIEKEKILVPSEPKILEQAAPLEKQKEVVFISSEPKILEEPAVLIKEKEITLIPSGLEIQERIVPVAKVVEAKPEIDKSVAPAIKEAEVEPKIKESISAPVIQSAKIPSAVIKEGETVLIPSIPVAKEKVEPTKLITKAPPLIREKDATIAFKILPTPPIIEPETILPKEVTLDEAPIVFPEQKESAIIQEPEEAKDVVEFEKELIDDQKRLVFSESNIIQPPAVSSLAKPEEEKVSLPELKKPLALAKGHKAPSANTVFLNESLKNIPQLINIEIGTKARVVGKNIRRFLVTQPGIIDVNQKNSDELEVIGKGLGYTYVHIWDDNGRWTTEWLGGFPKIEGLTSEEAARRNEESARNFKLLYTLAWSLSESGKGVGALGRTGYSWLHGLKLTGPTPYGNWDSAINVQRLKESVDLTYLTLGLTDAEIGPFKKFSLRAFDFSPGISNLAFPGVSLRGVTLRSPAFNNKLEYITFWGREGGGRYGNLSPSLSKIKNSFLDGFQLNYTPTTKQNYKFTLAHGWGRDRQQDLKNYAYDLAARWNFNKWNLGYEIANDTDKFAHLLTTSINRSKFRLTNELRNINRNFTSISGGASRQGELGALTTLYYNPSERFNITSSLDFYQTRLFPALDNDNRWNQDFNFNAAYKMASKTWFNLGYILRNDLGGISQVRYQSPSMGISHTFKLLKDVSVYTNYQHQENKNFTSPVSSYVNDRINSGVRFSLIGPLYYYLNKEINWLEEKYTGVHSTPHALETGLDWSDQIGKTPFRGNFRFTFRDEEDTSSSLSFLSGEDHIEGYSELSYRVKDSEIYVSTRFRNAWADNPRINKRIDYSFNAGMRYLWDTGYSWDPVGDISGYVFTDINSDGLRQENESGVKGVKVWLNKARSVLTDALGYYEFKKIKARKAQVAIETKSIPAGHVLTVPVTQDTAIAHNAKIKVDFGIISRSEISGFIFDDKDGDGVYGQGDKGIAGVKLTLEDGKQVTTDSNGRYVFSNAIAGEHTVSLDLSSIPIIYIPKVAIIQKIALFEGVAYNLNIPLRKIK